MVITQCSMLCKGFMIGSVNYYYSIDIKYQEFTFTIIIHNIMTVNSISDFIDILA